MKRIGLAFIVFFFYQNRFINKYARNKKSQNHGVLESRSFLVRYRRTYTLNNREKSQRGSDRERRECREINKEICNIEIALENKNNLWKAIEKNCVVQKKI